MTKRPALLLLHADVAARKRCEMTSSNAHQGGLKQKTLHELRRLVAIFLYLSAFFIVFRVYTILVLAEYQIDYFHYGLTLLKSLALAKIILTGETLRLGEKWFRTRPLIVLTVYFALVFSCLASVFEVVEHLIIGWMRGKSAAEVLGEIADKGWPHLVAMAMVVFVAFLPFFAFRETGRALGEGKLHDLFFKRRRGPESD
jgi:hypothetical protein